MPGKRKISLTLSPRTDGRFGKWIDGQYLYFGRDGDREGALKELAEYIRLRDRGLLDQPEIPQGPATVGLVATAFLDHLNARLARGTLEKGTFDDYARAVTQFVNVVGSGLLADDLTPGDFARVRDAWARELGTFQIDKRVQAVRTMHRWAERHRVVQRQPFYGDAFGKTTAKEHRHEARERGVDRAFGRRELVLILMGRRSARLGLYVPPLDGPLLAFVLLGLNGGLYSKDCSDLRPGDLKTERGLLVIDSYREKTGIRRRCPLWPETRAAVDATRAKSGDRLFLTIHGNAWNQGETDSVNLLFRRRLVELGIKREGVGFGALRHTHVRAVGDHGDLTAARFVRAHKASGIESHYDLPNLTRSLAVTDLARSRLLPACRPSATAAARAERIRQRADGRRSGAAAGKAPATRGGRGRSSASPRG